MLSETFWVAFITVASGLLLKIASMLFKSKCSECQMCCFKIRRDVVLEEKEHEVELFYKDKFRNENKSDKEKDEISV
jgi:hypothetical protein